MFLILRRRDGSETFKAPFPRSVKAGFRGTIRVAFAKRLRHFFPRVGNNYLLRHETCSDFHKSFENFFCAVTFFPRGHFEF